MEKILRLKGLAEREICTSFMMGCSGLAGLYEEVKYEDVEDCLTKALHFGVRMFDTAPHYGCGLSELRMGKAFLNVNVSDTKVYTKVGRIIIPRQCYVEGQHELEESNVPGSDECIFPGFIMNNNTS